MKIVFKTATTPSPALAKAIKRMEQLVQVPARPYQVVHGGGGQAVVQRPDRLERAKG